MSLTMIILLAIDAALLIGLLAYVVVDIAKKDSVVEEQPAPVEEQPAPVAEQPAPVAEQPAPVEEQPAPVEEQPAPVVEQPAPIEEVAVAEEDEEDELGDDREIAKRIPFAEKMLGIDVKTQSYYNELNNKFRSMRKINPRVSTKGVSYRLGRELVAKITVRGKTMKLHLALDVNAFESKIFFQKDLSDVKAYAEVPFTVKVKSDRGLKNAMKLVEELVVAKSIEYKTRFTRIDSIEALKD